MKMIKRLRLSWQLAITVLLAVAMVSTPFLGTATAHTSGNTQTGTSSATVTNAATVANSVSQVVYYSEKQELPDGGTNYVFMINGVPNTLHVAPDGFSPSTATDGQLAEYGFPARPKDAAGLAKWTSRWSRFKYKRPSAEPFLTLRTIKASAVNSNSPEGVDVQNIWSGYMDVDYGDPLEFNNAYGYYTQPTYNPTNSDSGAQEASWVGLGGYNTTVPLLQAGTTMETRYFDYAWYEMFPTQPVSESQFEVNSGDNIYANVYYNANTAGFEVFDMTTLNYFYITAACPASEYNGETAEFIDERPSNYDSETKVYTVDPLANYGSVSWSGCYVNGFNTNGTAFTALPYVEVQMNDGNLLSTPYPETPTYIDSFTDYFEQSE